jgi:hypothetical protein
MPSIRELAAITGIPKSTLHDRMQAAKASGFKVKGTSTLYDAEGNVKAEWVKTREDAPSLEEIGEQIRAALDGYEPPATFPAKPETTDANLCTLYPLADWHVGLLSWKKETGHNYDLKIGTTVIKTAMTRLIDGAPNSKQAVLLGLGDLLHADNYKNETSQSKNDLDVDGRYPRVLKASTDLIIYSTDLALQKHEEVLLRILPGNHDEQSAIAVGLALSLYYQNSPRVTVDDDAGRFWWWLWGKVLLGATHGDKAKMKDLPLIMAARNPEAWGKAKFRHIHTGHIHTDTMIDKGGVTVESHQTPVAPDSWHVAMGYGAGRSVKAITYSKDQGEIIRQRVNIV